MPDFIPRYRMTVAPAKQWPTNEHGSKTAVEIKREGSGQIVARLPIMVDSPRGRTEILRIARHLVKTHNAALAAHRREQAQTRATRLKLIKEKQA